jgi:GrpB-like predicted nucleotidyltransferase (UPF0157 family)
MARTMRVVTYSDRWPRMYAQEADLLRNALGDQIVRIHHIGSTSVPGLDAKPVIDILLEVRSLSALDALTPAMVELGYEPRGEFGIPGRRYYPKGGERRTHHVHAFVEGDPHVQPHLAFRDFLRAHPDQALDYANIKRQAAAEHGDDPEGYVAYKSAFVETLVTDAVHWQTLRANMEEESG